MAEAPDNPSTAHQRARVTRLLPQIAFLAVLWLLFSGKFDPLHLGYGVLSIGLVLVLTPHLSRKPDGVPGGSALAAVRPGKAVVYPFWLFWQIVLANFQVAVLILQPRPKLAPLVVRFRFPVRLRVAKMVLGNSITLTPGTFTVRVRGDVFVVHAITREAAASLLSGEMQRRVAAVFGCELDRDDDSSKMDLKLRDRFSSKDGDLSLGDEFEGDRAGDGRLDDAR